MNAFFIKSFEKIISILEYKKNRLRNPIYRFILISVTLITSFALVGFSQALNPTKIRIGVYENEPKIYTTKDGVVTGFWPELIQYIAKENDWQIEWVHCTWEECLQKLRNNEIDMMPDVGLTSERSQIYDFSTETVLISWARVYVPKGSKIESILDLEGKKIAGLSGSLNFDGPEGIKQLISKFGVQSTFIEKKSYTEVFQALKDGEADAGVTNKDFGNLNEQSFDIVRSPIVIQPTQINFAFTKNAKNTPYLIETIDKQMKILKSDQKSIYYQLQNQYLGENTQATIVNVIPQWVIYVITIGFGLIVFLLIVSVTSKGIANRQTAELQTSEARFRALFDSIPDLIFRYDAEGNFLDYHAKNENKLYAPPEQFLGRNVRDILPSDLANVTIQKIQKTLETNSIQIYEYQLGFGGEDRDFEARYSACGKNEVMAIIRDVTERRQAENRIQLLNRLYATLSQINQTIVHTQNRKQLFQDICQVALEFGKFKMAWIGLIDEKDLLVKPVVFAGEETGYLQNFSIAYLDPEYGSGPTGTAIREGRCVVSRDIANDPKMHLWRDRATKRGYYSSASVPLKQGNNIIGVFTVYASEPLAFDSEEEKLLEEIGQEISFALDNLQVELESQIANQELTKSEERYQTLANISPVGIFRTDVDGRTTYVNPTWSVIAGIPAEEAFGAGWLKVVHSDDRERIIENWEIATKSQSKITADYRFVHQDGSIIWVIGQAVPELNPKGETIGYVGTITDITERKQIEDLRMAVEKAQSADRLKSAFLATMSHELRTPLNSIIGFTGILLQKIVGPLSDEQDKQLKMVQGSAKHLLDLINDVLDISKIEAGEIEIRNEKLIFGEIIQKSVEKIQPLADKNGLVLTVDVDPPIVELISDRRRLEQVLLNLLSNAVKFTEKGEIHIESKVENDWLITSVRDSGIGIKQEDQDSLFIPFKQVDSGLTRKYEGTGLGLSICKRIIELLKGKIWVESEWGKGSTFIFTLPLYKENNE